MASPVNSQNFFITILAIFLIGCTALFLNIPASKAGEKAHYIFKNAAIYTVNEKQPWAEAIAVRANKILYVGRNKDMDAYIGDHTKIIDGTGKMILPGFIDSHVHPIWGGKGLVQVNLRDATTIKQVQEKLLAYRAQHPDIKFILGGSWRAANFPDEGPRKEWIDEVISVITVLVSDHFGHSAWANSKALEVAGLDKNTADPVGGYFVHDPETNELTGTIREFSAIKIAYNAIKFDKEKLNYDAMKRALKYLNSNGITSFITAYMVGDPLGETFVKLYNEGELTARTILSFKVTTERSLEATLAGIKKRRAVLDQIDQNFIRANMAKIFLDGVILNHEAAMLAPYVGEYSKYNSTGYLFSDDEIKAYGEGLNKAGLQLHFHTVGDGAARQALDTIEHVMKVSGQSDIRANISHLTVVSPDDYHRFGPLKVYANSQFFWSKHHEVVKSVEDHFGPERSKYIYSFGAIHKAGATMVGGSDWPVSTASPFAAMQMAATRPRTSIHAKGAGAYEGEDWLPEQKLGLETTIRAFTINGARLQRREHVKGSLEVGKFADLILVDRNIFTTPLATLHEAKVLMTMVDGKIVFRQD